MRTTRYRLLRSAETWWPAPGQPAGDTEGSELHYGPTSDGRCHDWELWRHNRLIGWGISRTRCGMYARVAWRILLYRIVGVSRG